MRIFGFTLRGIFPKAYQTHRIHPSAATAVQTVRKTRVPGIYTLASEMTPVLYIPAGVATNRQKTDSSRDQEDRNPLFRGLSCLIFVASPDTLLTTPCKASEQAGTIVMRQRCGGPVSCRPPFGKNQELGGLAVLVLSNVDK